MICNVCGRKFAIRKSELKVYGVSVGNFESKVCRCGSVVFNEQSIEDIGKALVEKDLFGLGSVAKVGKVGDCLVIRVSKRLAEFLLLKKGLKVKVYPTDRNKLLIEVPYFIDGLGYQKDNEQTSVSKEYQKPT